MSERTDATIWAEDFVKTKELNNWTLEDIDKGLMIGWFANAIMAGYDAGRKAGESLVIDDEPNHGG